MPNLTAKFTYANVAATLALVFSMTGGALAASHYLVNSTKQINPKVLKALKGPKGTKGAAGAAGPAGPTGSPGAGGTTGATGREGKQGQGLNGEAGLQGETGGTGPTGPTGPQGVTGLTGGTGEKGVEGKPGGEGKQGSTGAQGATGENGGTGAAGPTGPSGNPLAYAHVSEKGVLLESDNVGGVTEPEEGIFCLSGITGTPHTVSATIDYNESLQLPGITATLGDGHETCPPGTGVTVETFVAVLKNGNELIEQAEAQGFFVTVN